MFELGWTEIVVIAIVLIIVVGPKDLPGMLRSFGRMMTKLRSMAGEFRSQFDEVLKEAELDDVKKTLSEARKLNPARELRDAMNPLKQAGEGLKADLDRTMREKPKSSETVAKKDPGASEATAAAAASGGAAATGAAKPAGSAASVKPSPTETAKSTASASSSTSAASKPAAQKPASTAGTARKPAAAKPAARKSGAGGTAVKAAPKKTAAVKKTPAKSKAGDA